MGFWRNLADGVDNFIEFQSTNYRRQIERMNEDQLRAEHQRITRKLVSILTALGVSTAAIPSTLVSAIPAGISARRLDVNTQRKEIIEARLAQKGWAGHELNAKDMLYGVLPGAVVSHIAPGSEHLVEHGVRHVAERMMVEHGAGQAAVYGASEAIVHHGSHHVAERVGSHLAAMAGDHSVGAHVVNGAAGTVSEKAVGEAVYHSTHNVLERGIDTAGHWALTEGTDKAVGQVVGVAVDMVEKAIETKGPGEARRVVLAARARATAVRASPAAPHAAAVYASSAKKRKSPSVKAKAATVSASTAIKVPISTDTRSVAQQPHGHTETWRALRILALFLPAISDTILSVFISAFVLRYFASPHSKSRGRLVSLLDDIVVPVTVFSFYAQHLWFASSLLAAIQMIGLHRILQFFRRVFSVLWRWLVVLTKVALYVAAALLAAFVLFCVCAFIVGVSEASRGHSRTKL